MTTKIPNVMLVGGGGGGSALPSLVSYTPGAIPLNGNYYTGLTTLTASDTWTPGAEVNGSSYFITLAPSAYTPNVSAFTVISGTYSNSVNSQATMTFSAVPQLIWTQPGAIPFAPVFSSAPAIIGTPTVGSASSYTAGSVTGSPTPSITQQWNINGTPVGGATGSTYTPVSGDNGRTLTVTETATNSQGMASSTSAGKTVTSVTTSLAIVSGTPRTGTLNFDSATLSSVAATDWIYIEPAGGGTQFKSGPLTKGFTQNGSITANSSWGITVQSASQGLSAVTAESESYSVSAGTAVVVDYSLSGFTSGNSYTIEISVGTYNASSCTLTASLTDSSASPAVVNPALNNVNTTYKVHYTAGTSTTLSLILSSPNASGSDQAFCGYLIVYPGTI